MEILITNDDGIYAEGLFALSKQIKKLGNVTVVAPDSERSSVGHAITLAHPIRYKKVKKNNTFFGYGISGTPADCVKFALNIICEKKPDLILSGINLGQNDGCSVFYSGTVAGAREGSLMGIPSMAISLGTFVDPDFSYAAKCSLNLCKQINFKEIPKGTFLNVNVPNKSERQIKGVRYTKQGMVPIHGAFRKRTDPNLRDYYWMTGKYPNIRKDDGSDTYALSKDYVTIAPIMTDLTDYKYLNTLKKYF